MGWEFAQSDCFPGIPDLQAFNSSVWLQISRNVLKALGSCDNYLASGKQFTHARLVHARDCRMFPIRRGNRQSHKIEVLIRVRSQWFSTLKRCMNLKRIQPVVLSAHACVDTAWFQMRSVRLVVVVGSPE